jgi:hypothetical protein
MFDLKSLASAKTKVQKKRVQVSGDAYEDAVAILQEFEMDPDKEKLEDASNKLLASIQYNPDHVQSYICLAYIFFMLGDSAWAFKYIITAESLMPDLPEEIWDFKNTVIASLPYQVR